MDCDVILRGASILDGTADRMGLRRAPNRRSSGIATVVLNGRIVVTEGWFDPSSRAGQVLRSQA